MSDVERKIKSLLPYIPGPIVKVIGNADFRVRRVGVCNGAILYFDLVGFTAQTAKFSSRGEAGIEELQNILSEIYNNVLKVIYKYNGLAYQFAGDSVLIGVNKSDGETDADVVARAISCIGEIYALFRAKEKIQNFTFKLACSYGSYSEMLLGNNQTNYMLSVKGDPVVSVGALMNHSSPDFSVSDEKFFSLLPDGIRNSSNKLDANVFRLGIAEAEIENVAFEVSQEINRYDEAILKKCNYFVLPAIYNKLVTGYHNALGEFRDVVSVFVRFEGDVFENGDAGDIARHYNKFYETIKKKCESFGGNLFQVDLSDKGNVFLIVFGAPIALGQKEVMATRFALSVIEESAGEGFPEKVQIGMTVGLNYCGDVGASFRKDYTVIGESVNLASRLMVTAKPGEIIIDEVMQARIAKSFEISFKANMKFKGIEQMVPAYFLGKEISENTMQPDYEEGFIGRDSEMASLRESIAESLQKRGQTVIIEGEPGIGKSRLLKAFLENVRKNGFVIYSGASFSHEQYTPYFIWKNILSHFFNTGGTDGNNTVEFILNNISMKIREAGDIDVRWAPVIASLLGFAVEEEEMTKDMDARQKRDRIFEILFGLFKKEALGKPVALCLEDVHWIDDISLGLMEFFVKSAGDFPLLIIAATRPDERIHKLEKLPLVKTINLNEMGEKDSRLFIQSKLPLEEKNEGVENLIISRSNGNPFFMENIIQSFQEHGYVERQKNGKFKITKSPENMKIPNSIQDIVHQRIDSLHEFEQILIKTASVIGRVFLFELIGKVLPEVMRANVKSHLDNLHNMDLTPVESISPLTYIFKHVVIRDVAYNALLRSTRQEIHGKIGELIEEKHSDRLSEVYNILAYHYEHSGNYTKAIRFALGAADAAKSIYANKDAVHYYEKAISMLEMDHSHPETLKYSTMKSLAHVFCQTGEYARSLDLYSKCLDYYDAKQYRMERSQVHFGLGQVYQEMGDLPKTVSELEHALKLLGKSIPSSEVTTILAILNQVMIQAVHYFFPWFIRKIPGKKQDLYMNRINTLKTLAKVYFFTDVNKLAWAGFYELNLSERIRTDKILSGGWSNYATILQSLGFLELAEKYLKKSLECAERANDPGMKAIALERYGCLSMYSNDLEYGRDLLDKSIVMFQQVGNMWEMMMGIAVKAILWHYEGTLEISHKAFHDLKIASEKLGSKMHIAWAVGAISFIDYLRKELEYAEMTKKIDACIESSLQANDMPGEILMYSYECRATIYNNDAARAKHFARLAYTRTGLYKVVITHIQLAYIYGGEAALFAAGAAVSASEKKQLLKLAKKCARKGMSIGKNLAYIKGAAWRLKGSIAAFENKKTQARNAYENALKILESGPNREEYAVTLCEAGRFLGENDLFEKGIGVLSDLGNLGCIDYHNRRKNA